MLEKIFQRKSITARAYRKVFLDETGRLTPEAETVLTDLFDFTRFFKNTPADPQALAVVEGGRQALRHILKQTKTTDQELRRQLQKEVSDE